MKKENNAVRVRTVGGCVLMHYIPLPDGRRLVINNATFRAILNEEISVKELIDQVLTQEIPVVRVAKN